MTRQDNEKRKDVIRTSRTIEAVRAIQTREKKDKDRDIIKDNPKARAVNDDGDICSVERVKNDLNGYTKRRGEGRGSRMDEKPDLILPGSRSQTHFQTFAKKFWLVQTF